MELEDPHPTDGMWTTRTLGSLFRVDAIHIEPAAQTKTVPEPIYTHSIGSAGAYPGVEDAGLSP